MKTLLTTSILLFFTIFLQPPNVNKQIDGSWKVELNKNGIKISTREVPGMPLKEFKAITNLNATPAELEKIMQNIGEYKNWMSDVKSAKTIKQISSTERIEYLRITVPWPFDDRDIVNHSEIVRNTSGPNSFKIVITNQHNYIPEKDGAVRIKKSSGFWKFTPLEDGRTQLCYQFLGEPGGEVPEWLANVFIVDGPFATLTKLKELTD